MGGASKKSKGFVENCSLVLFSKEETRRSSKVNYVLKKYQGSPLWNNTVIAILCKLLDERNARLFKGKDRSSKKILDLQIFHAYFGVEIHISLTTIMSFPSGK